MIDLNCLGPPRLLIDGSDPPAQLLWKKHLALLVYLAHSPRARTRDHLIGLLWPDKDDSKARHSLNEALRVIRKAVGESLTTDGDNVVLDKAVVTLRTDLETSGDERGGVFLEGFSLPDAPGFEDWVLTERERHRAGALDRLVAESNDLLAGGAIGEGRDSALDAVELEPLHEPAVCALMKAYALEGARGLAIKAYERLQELLKRELDMVPSRETAVLAERIKNERIVPGAPASDSPANDLVPVIGTGRAALSDCIEVWKQAQSGHPGAVLVLGGPGTGKTRLADEVVARARLDGAVVAYTRSLENETDEGIKAALLKGGLLVPELSGAAPQVISALASLEPDLLIKFPAAKDHDAVPRDAEPFRQAVLAIAEIRPVLLVVDDAHHLDGKSLEALGAIVERAGDIAVCVLLTGTPGQTAPALDALVHRVGRDIPGRLVRTDAFGESDVDELIGWGFPDFDSDATLRLRRRVVADTGGNPFLAVELVRAVRSGFKVKDQPTSSAWPSPSRTLDETLPGELPESVSAALRVRFRSLTENAQSVLITMAVVGEAEKVGNLAKACEMSKDDVERALDELEWQRWLVGGSRRYRFVTRLAREVVLSDMVTGGQKRRILERLG